MTAPTTTSSLQSVLDITGQGVDYRAILRDLRQVMHTGCFHSLIAYLALIPLHSLKVCDLNTMFIFTKMEGM